MSSITCGLRHDGRELNQARPVSSQATKPCLSTNARGFQQNSRPDRYYHFAGVDQFQSIAQANVCRALAWRYSLLRNYNCRRSEATSGQTGGGIPKSQG